MSAPFPEDEIAWVRGHLDLMAEGGVWAVPRSGLVFSKRDGALVLIGRMPWTDDLAQALLDGLDVPAGAEAFRAYQDADLALIRGRFEAAGIPVTDSTSNR